MALRAYCPNIYSVTVFQYRNCFYSRSVKFLFYNVWTKPELSLYHLLLSVKHLDMFRGLRGSLELNITGIQFAEHFLEQCELDFKSQKLYKCTFVIKIAKTGNLTMSLCWHEKSILYRETSIFRRWLHVKQENPVAALVQRVFLHCISAFFNPAVSSTARTSKLWKRAKRCSSTSAHCCVFSNFCLVLSPEHVPFR